MRVRRRGSTDLPGMTIEDRFWRKVVCSLDSNGCWEWTGDTRNGYGSLAGAGAGAGRRREYAHRLAFRFANGDIPEGMCVCHRCDNPLCVRASHLFLGSNEENRRDMVTKGRAWYQQRGQVDAAAG